MAGGNDQMLNMGLMIAAGVAAPELAPFLMEGGAGAAALGIEGGLGATAATGITGATLGGAAGALTGQDVAKSAAMGGLGGLAAGYFGGVNPAESGSMLAAGPTTPGAGLSTVPVGAGAGANASAGFANINTPTPTDYANFTGQPISSAPPTVSPPSIAPQTVANSLGGATTKAAMIGGGAAGINALLSAPPNSAYVPPGASYTGGSLSKFKYDPNTYQPDIVRPPSPVYRAQYAEGGSIDNGLGSRLQNLYNYQQEGHQPGPDDFLKKLEILSGRNFAEGGITSLAMGGQPNQMYPMSQQEHTNFMDPTQLPASAMEVRNFEPATNPMTGNMTRPMASGGIAQLAVGGKLLKGDGDGMSDSIHANIDGRQQARLADGEFVIPADVVSHLGNGSTDAGAKHLYSMMDRVRQARVGNKKQGRQINPNRYLQA
jgi:hypothetical protein